MSQRRLFDTEEMGIFRVTGADSAPRAPVTIVVVDEARPEDWRTPGAGDHVCARCGGLAVYGLGPDWLCRAHVPLNYLPNTVTLA